MYWYNGKLVDKDSINLSIGEPGLLYGATLFTTMRVYKQSLNHPLTHWRSHCDRLKHSIISFNWQQPDWQRLHIGVKSLITHFPVIRIVVFPDGKEWITGRQLPADLITKQQQGITAWIAEDSIYRRSLCDHKTGNYLPAYLALQKAYRLKAQEAILVDSKGNWLETSTGNLWGYKDDCWYTPKLDSGILPGIVRSHLLNWIQKQGFSVAENIWDSEFIKDLDRIAYSNCVVQIIPINNISGLIRNNHQDNLTPFIQNLQHYFQNCP